MKLYNILILFSVAILLVILIYVSRNHKEHLVTSNNDNETFYAEQDDRDSTEESDKTVDSLLNSKTSVDDSSYPEDSQTSVTETNDNITLKSIILKKNKVLPNSYDFNNYHDTNKKRDKLFDDYVNFPNMINNDPKQNNVSYKIAKLHLEDNTNLPGKIKSKKIKEIYDELTSTNIAKSCVDEDCTINTAQHGYFNNNNLDNGVSAFDKDQPSESSVLVAKYF